MTPIMEIRFNYAIYPIYRTSGFESRCTRLFPDQSIDTKKFGEEYFGCEL